ncbi:hypothetical protein [Ferribacterium limneticum]|jgi:hypothetical protein|uniref:hypothetical protein n=1 Tax=Ferribacterium limneticum TaxID=76259 RepID=UPI001CF9E7B8|nr:hypothetical protein [Ferribacterium limneticum]UCV18054.1 hypothetical protein KI610_14705 [Ferribacterium limneticum]
MNIVHQLAQVPSTTDTPPEGTRRIIDGLERVFYDGYWIKTYPVPADTLEAKKKLIDALTRRLFNHTEHGLNIPGTRLHEARSTYEAETDPARKRVKGAMLAGALFNRAADIFRKLVELQACGIEILSDNPLMRECGKCLLDAMELGRCVMHRSGEEGIDELWGEPFRAFSIPLEDFYESRYIKIGQVLRDIDLISNAMIDNFSGIPAFSDIEAPIRDLAIAAKIKTETLRTDSDIFDVWARMVTAGERLADLNVLTGPAVFSAPFTYNLSDGLQLIRQGRDLIFYVSRARTAMPKSTREYIERCKNYLATGRAPLFPAHFPA